MSRITEGKVVIFSAPSGAGKSTIIGRLLEKFPRLEFSISCTSRPPRGKEVHGREYYFLSNDEFKARAGAGEFVEWEEVYPGTCYGTLRSEVDRIWEKGSVIVFDVDVKGGVNLKKTFGRKRPVRLHHAAFGRGAAAPAWSAGEPTRPERSKSGWPRPSRRSPMPRSSTG